MRELETIYEETRGRITGLVADADGDATRVPACPEWTVHDLLAHLAGNCADIIAGNLEGVTTSAWTSRQVDARRDRPTAEILEEWNDAAPQVSQLLDDFPGRYGQMVVADVVSHEHDIRGALGRPGERQSAGVTVALDFLVSVFLHTGITALGLDPIEVRSGERSWIVGTGGPPTRDFESWRGALMPDADQNAGAPAPAGALSADPFELMRSVAGRRSRAQIKNLGWSMEPGPYVSVFGFGPFEVRATELHE
jgi:uncharacterized protein (TIGR03083 family)